MTHAHVACESKLRSVVMSSMHPCPGDRLAIGRAVVYYARDAHAFSAWIMHQSPGRVGWDSVLTFYPVLLNPYPIPSPGQNFSHLSPPLGHIL